MPSSVPSVRMTTGRTLPSFSSAPASGSSSGTFRICDAKRAIFMTFPSPISRHCEERSDEAIPIRLAKPARDCFASLAMTGRLGAVAVDRLQIEFETEAKLRRHRELAVLLHRHL